MWVEEERTSNGTEPMRDKKDSERGRDGIDAKKPKREKNGLHGKLARVGRNAIRWRYLATKPRKKSLLLPCTM